MNLSSKRDFRENRLSDIHTPLKSVNAFVLVLYTLLDRIW